MRIMKKQFVAVMLLLILVMSVVSAELPFVASKDSEVFHLSCCPCADKIYPENRVYFNTSEEAISAGYRPCYYCKPNKTSEFNLSKFGESGLVTYVVDGDTIDVEGVGRIRFADIDTPEKGERGYQRAKKVVSYLCLNKTVYLDIDDCKIYGEYGRVVAVVYAPWNATHYVNLNQLLLKIRFAEADDYFNEFDPQEWIDGKMEFVEIN